MIARFDQGRLPVRLAPVDVDDVLADVRERFAIRSRETDRALVADTPDGLRLTADPSACGRRSATWWTTRFRHGRGTVRLSARAVERPRRAARERRGPGLPARIPRRRIRALHPRRRGAVAGAARASASRSSRRSRSAHQGGAGAANRPDGGADVWLDLPTGEVEPSEFRGIGSVARRARMWIRALIVLGAMLVLASIRAGGRRAHVRGRQQAAHRGRGHLRRLPRQDGGADGRAASRTARRTCRRGSTTSRATSGPPTRGRPHGRWSCSPRTRARRRADRHRAARPRAARRVALGAIPSLFEPYARAGRLLRGEVPGPARASGCCSWRSPTRSTAASTRPSATSRSSTASTSRPR